MSILFCACKVGKIISKIKTKKSLKEQLELTSTFQRQKELQISCGEIFLENEINDYEKQILKKIKSKKVIL